MARPILWSKAFTFALSGGLGALAGAAASIGIIQAFGIGFNPDTVFGFGFSFVSMGSMLLLGLAQNWYVHRQIRLNGRNWGALFAVAVLGGAVGIAWSFSFMILGAPSSVIFIGAAAVAILGIGMGGFAAGLLPNVPHWPVILLAAVVWPLFSLLSVSAASGSSSAFAWLGFEVGKGAMLGFVLPVVEGLSARTWLKFERGKWQPIINLGRQPIGITADGKLQLNLVGNEPNLVLRYRQEHNQIVCDDFLSQATVPPESGKQRVVGSSLITVWADSATAAAVLAPPVPDKPAPGTPKAAPAVTPKNVPPIPQIPTPVPANPQPKSKPCNQYTLQLSNGSHLILKLGICLSELELRGLESAHADQRTVAEVNSHPQNPELLGLKNHSLQTWQLMLPNEGSRPIEPGRSARLSVGNQIKFVDFMEGEITD